METEKTLINKVRIIKCLKLITVVILFFCSTGCVSMMRIDGPYEGKVVDAETGKPIAGAVVHGTWYKVHPTPAGSSSEYYDSYEMLTDKNGEFKIPGKGLQFLSSIDEIIITLFKSGYEQITPSVWKGLKAYSLRNKIIWEGTKVTFRLKHLSMGERHKRSITMLSEPDKKQRLLWIERNKENIELGLPSNTLHPVE